MQRASVTFMQHVIWSCSLYFRAMGFCIYRLFINNVAHIKEDNKIDPKSEILNTNG